MNGMRQNHRRCIIHLLAWLVVLHMAAAIVRPSLSLSRTEYPMPLDLLILTLVPIGAFCAAKFPHTKAMFTTYGGLASIIFWLHYLFFGQTLSMVYNTDFRWRIITACIVTVSLAVLSRAAADIRHRWDKSKIPPEGYCTNCGYNLTGNTSGQCPECGTVV